jgi:hypothetical protein
MNGPKNVKVDDKKSTIATFEILTAVLMEIQVFWDIMPC